MKQKITSILADNFDTDLKAEVIAAELIENAVPAEQIMILLLGSMKRSFRKDVDAVTEEISDYNNKEYTLISTHKEGIYDMLPEGLFHSPTVSKSATTQKEIIENIKRHRREESHARRFFLPYEAAINHLRIQMALYESRLDKGAHHNELVNIFKNYWEIFHWLDTAQSNIFLQVLPLIHDARDDYEVAADIFELILLLPVSITGRRQPVVKSETPFFSSLDKTILGKDLTTGNALFDSGADEILVTIGPLSNKELETFRASSRNQKILELLCDYLLPVHLDISTAFEINSGDKIMRLTDKENDHNSELGLSTFL